MSALRLFCIAASFLFNSFSSEADSGLVGGTGERGDITVGGITWGCVGAATPPLGVAICPKNVPQ
jgi:hypothetical protein